jgi:hypothetical protein
VKRRQQNLKEVGGEGIFKATLAAVMQMYCCSLVSLIQSTGLPDYQDTVDLPFMCVRSHSRHLLPSLCLPVCLSVLPYVCMYQHSPHQADFCEICY